MCSAHVNFGVWPGRGGHDVRACVRSFVRSESDGCTRVIGSGRVCGCGMIDVDGSRRRRVWGTHALGTCGVATCALSGWQATIMMAWPGEAPQPVSEPENIVSCG